MNNWDSKTVTFMVNTFSLDGNGVQPMVVDSKNKLATTWANLKDH